MLRRRACREAREKGVGEERSQAKQTNSLRVRQPRGLEFRCGPAPVRREREGESVLNNLVQTGYHTTNQTDRHAKPHKTGKDHNPDREKLRPGASSTPPAETATACTTGVANATEDGGASTGPTPGIAAAEAGGTAAAPPPSIAKLTFRIKVTKNSSTQQDQPFIAFRAISRLCLGSCTACRASSLYRRTIYMQW